MKILVINPVGHSTWDEADRELYLKAFEYRASVEVTSLPQGPPSVETEEAYRTAVSLVIGVGQRLAAAYDGVVVNCFLDPGAPQLRRALGKPVVGAGEATLTIARYQGAPLYVVTVGARKEALEMMWRRVRELGMEGDVADIIGLPLGVMDIDANRERALTLLTEAVMGVARRGGVPVLGCTGLSSLSEEVQRRSGHSVVDPVRATALFMEALLRAYRR